MEFFGTVNAAIGFIVQAMRARPNIPEWASSSTLVILSLVAYWLGTEGANPATKEFWRQAWVFVAVSAGAVYGFSVGAKMAVSAGAERFNALRTHNGANAAPNTKEG